MLSKYKEKLKILAENGISYSALEDLLLSYPKIESNISLREKIDQLTLPLKNKTSLTKLLENLNYSYANSEKIIGSDKTLWSSYKNDLCMLVQALESWESSKKNDSYENM